MTSDAVVIVQLPRGSAVDQYLRTYPPPGVAAGRAVVEPLAAEPDGRLGPPENGEVVMSVLSPEALTRDQRAVRDVIRRAAPGAEPLVIIVEAAEELREDELAAVLDAATRARRSVILRVMAGLQTAYAGLLSSDDVLHLVRHVSGWPGIGSFR